MATTMIFTIFLQTSQYFHFPHVWLWSQYFEEIAPYVPTIVRPQLKRSERIWETLPPTFDRLILFLQITVAVEAVREI